MASRWFRVLVALCACFLCFYLVDEAARFAAWFGCGAYAPFYCPHAFSGLSWRSAQGALSRLRRKPTGDRPAPAPSPPSVGPRPPTGALPARFLPDVKQDVKRQKIEVCGGKCFDNLFTLTSAHLFSRERKYFFSRAHTFFLTIKNVGTHSFGAQKADLRAARRASAGSFLARLFFFVVRGVQSAVCCAPCLHFSPISVGFTHQKKHSKRMLRALWGNAWARACFIGRSKPPD